MASAVASTVNRVATYPPDLTQDQLKKLMGLTARYERLKSDRYAWEAHWQDIRFLVNPDASDFNRRGFRGDRRTEHIFDGTAPWANEQLASGLHSFLTSPTDRWFNLEVENYDFMADDEVLLWLELVSDIIYDQYCKPVVNTNDTLHESYQDLGSFGTSVIYQDWNEKTGALIFRSYSLGDCWIQENSDGIVDTMFRRTLWTTRQITQEFGTGFRNIDTCKDLDMQWEVIHAVFPRADRNNMKMDKLNKKFASFYFSTEAKAIFRESGYDAFPYHVPRWMKRSGEPYGRSPAMTCLPDIKLVNAMEKVQLKSVQKIVDPPLMVPSDGFMLPIITTPGGLIFYETGTADNQMLRPLETKGRVDIGEDKMKQKRDHIMRCFYADWIQREKKKERQTATEVMDDRDEMLQLMSPILGRLQTELCGPMLVRSYNLLVAHSRIPPAPPQIAKRILSISYVSPAAIAQLATKATAIRRFMEELIPLAQQMPDIMDAIDPDEYAKQMALIQNVSRKILRSPEIIAQIRQQRAQQQQLAQAAATAQPAAEAVKSLSEARQMGGMGGPQLATAAGVPS
jgi:Bacteriophage head to tail connecting protein